MHRSIRTAALLPGLLLVPHVAVAQSPGPDRQVAQLVEAVSAERLGELVHRLASFETRHTLSSVDDAARGIGAARQWILEELQSYSPRLQVDFDTYMVPAGGRITWDVELRNVKAVLPGRSDRRIYVIGHYDTVARRTLAEVADDGEINHDNLAPGANDDGSGTALTMELARILSQSGLEFDATLVFMPVAGEEQGLVGARLHAERAREEGIRIDAVFSNDIVGNIEGGNGVVDGASVRVFSEGPEDSSSRQLARYIRRVGAMYVPGHQVRLIARHDRFGRGGDHSAFNASGYTAVRFTESRENYARQHTVDDTADGVDPEYLARNAQVNIAGVASLALAPPAPGVADGAGRLTRGPSGYDAHMQWSPSPGAVGYRVFWRSGWTLDWEHELVVGEVTEVILPNTSIDDYFFGVAAIGPEGHESLVSAYVR